MLKVFGALFVLVLVLAACDTNTTALPNEHEGVITRLSAGSGPYVTEDDIEAFWEPLIVGENSGYAVVEGFNPPSWLGTDALQLHTGDAESARAELVYRDVAGILLSAFVEDTISYRTYQPAYAGNPSHAAVAYKIEVCLYGVSDNACNGYTTLVYEPYWNLLTGIIPETWQLWDNMRDGK